MDLIHADENLVEIGYVREIDQFDAEVTQETDADIHRNSFSLTISDKVWEADPIEKGHYIYSPGTEFGGLVESIVHSTKRQQITVSGVTWRGMLFRKVIEPPTGEAYRIVSGEANAAIEGLLDDALGTLFTVSISDSGITVSRQFRYTNLLLGIEQMLGEAGGALEIEFNQATKKVNLSVRAVVDYSASIDLSQDYGVDMVTTMGGYDRYNHVIALGAGELTAREVIHVYRLANGTLTTTAPSWAGTKDDLVVTYEYSNATSDELESGAKKRLKELSPLNQIEMDPSVDGLDLKLGDIVGVRDRLTGMSASAAVVGKIATISAGQIRIETRVR